MMPRAEYALQQYLKILKVFYTAKFPKFAVISSILSDGANSMQYVTPGVL